MKTKPLWQALTGAPFITAVPTETPILGTKLAKITFPVGKNRLTLPCTREVADAIQKTMTLEIVDYAE